MVVRRGVAERRSAIGAEASAPRAGHEFDQTRNAELGVDTLDVHAARLSAAGHCSQRMLIIGLKVRESTATSQRRACSLAGPTISRSDQ